MVEAKESNVAFVPRGELTTLSQPEPDSKSGS